MMKVVAFAPGHISAFFEPIYHPQDVYRSGSRGAGMSISLGATTEVTIDVTQHQTIVISVNNKTIDAPVTRRAIQNLIGDAPLKVCVQTMLDLPVSQGFGMSAAGALSTTTALSYLLQISPDEAIKAAHAAEVQLRSGLGDVIAASFGGIEIRREPGLPPWGMLEHIPGTYDVVLCVIGKKMETKKILSNPKKLAEIASYGRYCTKKILDKPSIEQLFILGQEFTKKIGLADKKVLEAIQIANQYGMASMCMLGNSVFAVGQTQKLCKILEAFGKIYVCSISTQGSYIL
jgi:pantoate kinase